MPHTLKQCWRQGVCRCALLCGACAASEIAPRRAPGAAGRVVADLARALRPDQSRRELWHRVSTGALLMGWRGRKRIYKGKRGQRVCSLFSFFLSLRAAWLCAQPSHAWDSDVGGRDRQRHRGGWDVLTWLERAVSRPDWPPMPRRVIGLREWCSNPRGHCVKVVVAVASWTWSLHSGPA